MYVCIFLFNKAEAYNSKTSHISTCTTFYRISHLLKCKEIIKKKLAHEGLEQGGSIYKRMYLCLCSICVCVFVGMLIQKKLHNSNG